MTDLFRRYFDFFAEYEQPIGGPVHVQPECYEILWYAFHKKYGVSPGVYDEHMKECGREWDKLHYRPNPLSKSV